MKNLPTPPRCLLIADDLTGACDAALQFTVRGAKSVVYLEVDRYEACKAEIHAFNTETRGADFSDVEEQLQRIAVLTSELTPRILFKKIDSLLRGNPGGEIASALKVFECDVALITPAFPDLGRTVREGHLEVVSDPAWKPLAVAPLLRSQGLSECEHPSPEALVEMIYRGGRHISLDASSYGDLLLMVSAALTTGKKILWAGSAGLAAALADVMFTKAIVHETLTPGVLPVVFCIGSTHAVTQAQLQVLQEQRRAIQIDLGADTNRVDPESVTDALAHAQHVLVRVPRGQVSAETLRMLLERAKGKAAAIVTSGGDTAATVCRALGAGEIDISGQVTAGLPWGRLRGGVLDGFAVATKSGAFGLSTDLVRAADFFTCGA